MLACPVITACFCSCHRDYAHVLLSFLYLLSLAAMHHTISFMAAKHNELIREREVNLLFFTSPLYCF